MRVYLVCLTFFVNAVAASAATINVNPGQSVQAAIDAAANGDRIVLAAGTFNEDINYNGKAVTVVGQGKDSVLQGTGTGPVVTFESGEDQNSVLDSVFVTGGSADSGGGVRIVNASPLVLRNIIANNAASRQGSGVYLENSVAELYNNLIVYNYHTSGDPHGVQIRNASPIIINNTIAKIDSNGIFISGTSAPLIMNNIIARNGSTVDGTKRGRGICDFSGGNGTLIQYNDFYKNRKAAILLGQDYKRIRSAQDNILPPRLLGNVDGNPKLGRSKRKFEDAVLPDDFFLRIRRRPGRSQDSGNPNPIYNDLDGSRNDMGFTGGPFATP